MSDTAKKCPNCGYKQKNIFQYKGSKNMVMGLIISVISIGLLILAMPTMSGFSMSSEIYLTEDDFWYGILEVVGSCILFFIGCKFFKQYTTKTSRIVLIFIVIAILGTAINMGLHGVKLKDPYYSYSENAQDASTEQNTDSHIINKDEENYLGTYIYNQPDNSGRAEKLIIILNDDETAIAKATKRGEEKTYYGSWSRYGDNIRLSFTDAYFTWNGRTTSLLDAWIDWGEAINVDGAVIRDGYLYANSDMAKAKNPENRVKLEKTK